jgi:hypothetical protein
VTPKLVIDTDLDEVAGLGEVVGMLISHERGVRRGGGVICWDRTPDEGA